MKKIDTLLLLLIIVATLFGLLMIYDASSVIAFRDFNDKYHYIKDQLIWMSLGYIALAFFSFFDYRKLHAIAVILLIIAIGLLIGVFIPGIGIHALGANRWIGFGSFTLQPAEFVKLSLAIYLAAWFSKKEKKQFRSFAALIGTVFLLVIAQPDMGTASIILFEAFIIYYLSGGSLQNFILAGPVVGFLGLLLILIAPYRAARLTSFLGVDKALQVSGNTLDASMWHVRQILIALGSGGVIGVGLGNSLQKYAYLPENVTDSIFAIIAEEFGLVGTLFLIILLLVIIWRGFFIASRVKDLFGKLLASGITGFLGIQMVINMGAMTALFPLTGVPLPFISYGGSSLIVDLAAIGIILNISRHIDSKERKKIG